MAKQKRREPEREMKTWSLDEIKSDIRNLQRRIEEIKNLQQLRPSSDDGSIEAVESNVKATIRDIFGIDSPEYDEYKYFEIAYGPSWRGMTESDIQERLSAGYPRIIEKLKRLISRLEEKGRDLDARPGEEFKNTFRGLQLHQKLVEASSALFLNGHYTQAILEGAKDLIIAVKDKSGKSDLDGVPLMQTLFSVKNPILRWNDLQNDTERDNQQGNMHLFIGTVLALRNPRAHANITDDPARALEYIGFLNLLFRLLDESYT